MLNSSRPPAPLVTDDGLSFGSTGFQVSSDGRRIHTPKIATQSTFHMADRYN
jgi:hypothetical protein